MQPSDIVTRGNSTGIVVSIDGKIAVTRWLHSPVDIEYPVSELTLIPQQGSMVERMWYTTLQMAHWVRVPIRSARILPNGIELGDDCPVFLPNDRRCDSVFVTYVETMTAVNAATALVAGRAWSAAPWLHPWVRTMAEREKACGTKYLEYARDFLLAHASAPGFTGMYTRDSEEECVAEWLRTTKEVAALQGISQVCTSDGLEDWVTQLSERYEDVWIRHPKHVAIRVKQSEKGGIRLELHLSGKSVSACRQRCVANAWHDMRLEYPWLVDLPGQWVLSLK